MTSEGTTIGMECLDDLCKNQADDSIEMPILRNPLIDPIQHHQQQQQHPHHQQQQQQLLTTSSPSSSTSIIPQQQLQLSSSTSVITKVDFIHLR